MEEYNVSVNFYFPDHPLPDKPTFLALNVILDACVRTLIQHGANVHTLLKFFPYFVNT